MVEREISLASLVGIKHLKVSYFNAFVSWHECVGLYIFGELVLLSVLYTYDHTYVRGSC